jgi:glycolate oxidase iron-sulfur subunit
LSINQLISEADRCVKCALCLPHCPTYQIKYDEADSPRGRIALMQAWLQGDISNSLPLHRHLNSCLMCRSCEGVCPSGVKYGALMDGVRAELWQSLGYWPRLKLRLLLKLLSEQRFYLFVGPLLTLYQRSGLSVLLRYALPQRIKRLESMLPPLNTLHSAKRRGAEHRDKKRLVMLFTGCVSQLLERDVQQASITLLNALGCKVEVPREQACCGAMHRHNGDSVSADKLAEKNRISLSDASFDALVSMATGCCAELVEQGDFEQPVREICEYISQLDWPEDVILNPLQAKVAVHTSCATFYGGFDPEVMSLLLKKVPQLQVVSLPANLCCGAAGSYMLTEPEISRQLQDLKVEAVEGLQPDILVTNNTGCALQLRSGLREAGLDIEVLHPLQLLVRQLRIA